MPNIEVVPGIKVHVGGGWYQHNKVYVDGEVIQGFIQQTQLGDRSEFVTCFGSERVPGRQLDWLLRKNDILEQQDEGMLGRMTTRNAIEAVLTQAHRISVKAGQHGTRYTDWGGDARTDLERLISLAKKALMRV